MDARLTNRYENMNSAISSIIFFNLLGVQTIIMAPSQSPIGLPVGLKKRNGLHVGRLLGEGAQGAVHAIEDENGEEVPFVVSFSCVFFVLQRVFPANFALNSVSYRAPATRAGRRLETAAVDANARDVAKRRSTQVYLSPQACKHSGATRVGYSSWDGAAVKRVYSRTCLVVRVGREPQTARLDTCTRLEDKNKGS